MLYTCSMNGNTDHLAFVLTGIKTILTGIVGMEVTLSTDVKENVIK